MGWRVEGEREGGRGRGRWATSSTSSRAAASVRCCAGRCIRFPPCRH
ncbi:MAG: hypothetical protein ACKESB_00875 [Candidatus Hodgkinia cicadicola]